MRNRHAPICVPCGRTIEDPGSLTDAAETLRDLAVEIAVSDQIIAERNLLLDMFTCPEHGQCVPYAMAEVERLRADVRELGAALSKYANVDNWYGEAESADEDYVAGRHADPGTLLTWDGVGDGPALAKRVLGEP